MPQARTCAFGAEPAPSQGQSPALPSIPLATDLASALAAINAMRAHLQPPPETHKPRVGQQTPASARNSGAKTKKDKKGREGDFTELSRVTETVKVPIEDGEEEFIEVERINRLVLQNNKTGETWTWNRE